MIDIDPAAHKVILRDGAQVEYDSLIVATGSQGSYFGHNEWAEWAPALKTVEDATAIRHKVLDAFERAERSPNPKERAAWLTFVIVGGGATGVELAGTLGEIAHHTLKNDFRVIHPGDAKIFVVDSGSRILSTFPEDLARKAAKQLAALGAEVHTGLMVTNVDGNGVSAKNKAGEETHIEAPYGDLGGGCGCIEFRTATGKANGCGDAEKRSDYGCSRLEHSGFPRDFRGSAIWRT